MNAIKAVALLIFLVAAQKAAAGVMAIRYETGAVVLTNKAGHCPATYAVAYITKEPGTRLTGCWGMQERTVWVFMPMTNPLSFSADEFEVIE